MEETQAASTELAATTERMATAAEQLHALLAGMGEQMEALNRKIDRIVAAIDETRTEPPVDARTAELERQNTELRAAAERTRRKTLSATALAVLAKSGSDEGQALESGALEQALRSLSIEQRIAVKAEMARAGLI